MAADRATVRIDADVGPAERAIAELPFEPVPPFHPRMYPRPLLLGEAPSKHRVIDGFDMADFPMCGSVNRMMMKILEIDVVNDGVTPLWRQLYAELRERFDCENVFDTPLPKGGWPQKEATMRVVELMREEPNRVAVLCGRKVYDTVWEAAHHGEPRPAKSWAGPSWYTIQPMGTWVTVTIPHPSGLNRMYNDAPERHKAKKALSFATAFTGDGATVRVHTDTGGDSSVGWSVVGSLANGTVVASPQADLH